MPVSLTLDCSGRRLRLDRPRIMGVLNVTPDSFSDGGRFLEPEAAVAHARAMVEAGADIIDVGGESTRPGSEPVPFEEELRRVIPVLTALRAALPVPLSIDTSKPEVMRAAVAAGAGLINDVNGLRAPGALAAAADSAAAICVMHMRGTPRSMQREPRYDDVLREVCGFLAERASALRGLGVPADRIVLDPGFGFGKTLEHNVALFRGLAELVSLGYPVLVGVSRKSMLGAILGDRPVEGRVTASAVAAALAAGYGARIVRVHDVAATADALAVQRALGRTVGPPTTGEG
ncbi:dihydropteroate synthase [Thioalkalivibrio paradoxus]|uniref:Dihydropteroate synthase n=1 Tax=Thioalkalivibrio paradoxus ARh 1 TaxID=713585 RepID=W0DQ74_9GAMM|nr:dihydropteroate synthase [Thioalkalivibrio paradoxus]AHE99025.1 dihydropteroate synthase [Thioalkalivibrio paradoxus ARh 1]